MEGCIRGVFKTEESVRSNLSKGKCVILVLIWKTCLQCLRWIFFLVKNCLSSSLYLHCALTVHVTAAVLLVGLHHVSVTIPSLIPSKQTNSNLFFSECMHAFAKQSRMKEQLPKCVRSLGEGQGEGWVRVLQCCVSVCLPLRLRDWNVFVWAKPVWKLA